jgi:hypothetical protein
MTDEEWVDVRTAIVAVFVEEAERLREFDDSLIWDASGARRRNGDVSCWLSLWHRGAVDPHMELTAVVTGTPGSYGMGVDIGTLEGEVFAELKLARDGGSSLDQLTMELRQFLNLNADLLERIGTSPG